jgi:hypothetical protein
MVLRPARRWRGGVGASPFVGFSRAALFHNGLRHFNLIDFAWDHVNANFPNASMSNIALFFQHTSRDHINSAASGVTVVRHHLKRCVSAREPLLNA